MTTPTIIVLISAGMLTLVTFVAILGETAIYTTSLIDSVPTGYKSQVDVCNVRLGMFANQAIRAVSNWGNWKNVDKTYSDIIDYSPGEKIDYYNGYPWYGHLPQLYLGGILASDTNNNNVRICLSPLPGKETVIAIQRTEYYDIQVAPTMDSAIQGALNKYHSLGVPIDTTFNNGTIGHTMTWYFGENGSLSKDEINSNNSAVKKINFRDTFYDYSSRSYLICTPGEPCSLQVSVCAQNSNSGLAATFTVTIYDGDGYAKAKGEAANTINSLKDQLKQQELQNANHNTVKF